MSVFGKTLMVGLIAGFAGFAGIWAGNQGVAPAAIPAWVKASAGRILGGDAKAMATGSSETLKMAVPKGAVIYYRHPDDAAYSLGPKTAADGRAYLPVLASEDVSFDDAPKAADTGVAASGVAIAGSGTAEEKRVLYYRNPMGLPDTSPTPKKDSMGMDYLPVYDGEETDGSTITVSAGKIQRSGVKTTRATWSSISQPILVPGVVEHDERKVSVISLRTEAFVEHVADVTTGAPIKAGQPLVTLYAKEFATAGAQYATDISNGGKARAAGSLQRLLNLGVPAEMIAEIETTGKPPISVTLMAPQSGVVLERMAVDGMMAEAGETLFRIADTSTVWIIADVPEFELAQVQRGAAATVRFRSLPGREFTGNVDEIYPEIQAETRTAKIRIELPNSDGAMIAHMYADVEIAGGGNAPVVTVPDSAVIDSGDRQVVIVDLGEGRFEPRDVQVGLRGAGMVEIRQGVAEDETVVVSANFLIDAESNLKAALSALTSVEAKP
jgi:membrane fusion protein, copper/silver efflux system